MTQVWRINLKPASDQSVDPRKFAIEKGYLGIGWPVEGEGLSDWEKYEQLGREKYKSSKGWWKGVNAIKNRMKVNDLCWTRDRHGNYYLGRITGEWEYQTGIEFMEADLINTRKCTWIKIGTVDHVPGKVVNSFIPRSTVQRIRDKTVLAFSKFIFNQKSDTKHYRIEQKASDIFSLLSSEDCEDIIGIYLQFKFDYMMIPSTCKKDTMAYEFVLLHKETRKPAVVQVKNGYDSLNRDHYREHEEVFLFTTKGSYLGEPRNSIHCLEPMEIKEFVFAHSHLLPEKVQLWIDFLRENHKQQN
jgi:hypothetical protein